MADAQGAMLRGDPIRLAQIFGNLLTPPGGQIAVLVEALPARVRVVVRDVRGKS